MRGEIAAVANLFSALCSKECGDIRAAAHLDDYGYGPLKVLRIPQVRLIQAVVDERPALWKAWGQEFGIGGTGKASGLMPLIWPKTLSAPLNRSP